MILFIDTTRDTEIELALYDVNGLECALQKIPVHENEFEELLPAIDAMLKKNSAEISGIIVVKGPRGRFSAIRSGVAAANALGFALAAPVVGIENGEDVEVAIRARPWKRGFGKPVIPIYSKEPNSKQTITKP